MKTQTSLFFCFLLSLAFSMSSNADTNNMPLVDKVPTILGVQGPAIGTNEFNRAVCKSLNGLGGRKEMLDFIISRSLDAGLGLELSCYGSHLFLKWVATENEVVIRIDVQIALDDKLHAKSVSSVLDKRSLPSDIPKADVKEFIGELENTPKPK